MDIGDVRLGVMVDGHRHGGTVRAVEAFVGGRVPVLVRGLTTASAMAGNAPHMAAVGGRIDDVLFGGPPVRSVWSYRRFKRRPIS